MQVEKKPEQMYMPFTLSRTLVAQVCVTPDNCWDGGHDQSITEDKRIYFAGKENRKQEFMLG